MRPAVLRLRIAATAGVFFMLLVVALGRAFQLCVIEGASFTELAARQQRQRVALPPERGPIVDRYGDALALTVESAAVFVRPRNLPSDLNVISALAKTLDLPPGTVAERVRDKSPFVWLLRTATPEQAEAIAAFGFQGVGSESTWRRFYPRDALAGQVLGFSGIDSQGLEGVELAYDKYLRGASESLSVDRDARGRRMLTEGAWQPLPRQGAKVELTIDASLQQVAESELNAAVVQRRAAAGAAIVMDPATGEILALANVPRFDPNQVGVSTPEQWRNRVIADTYEPGSTMKAILAAAALEAGVVRPDDRVYCENGHYAVGRRVVHDHQRYGWLTFAEIIKHSSNIGAAKIGERLGAARFGAALKSFGFGKPTRSDLPGEVPGLVSPSEKWAHINLVTTSFGQGIAVTPLQMVRAYAAIANGGKLMRPYIVRRVIAPDGSVLREEKPEVVAQPVSAQTASIVTDLLRGVVEGGTGTNARIDGVPVAGKTGTAQKVDGKTGRYSARDRMSSFIGYVPADAPRLVILVVIDSPRTATYGGTVAAPVFRAVAEFGLDRLGLRVAAAPAPRDDAAIGRLNWSPKDADRGMPSFIGLSMREALVQAARAGWDVQVTGSGFVVAQDPPPGTQTATNRKLELRFGSAAS
jgi:cell division protein FtsI (penicillin-binding protein 3)